MASIREGEDRDEESEQMTESLVELSRGSRQALLVNSCPECGSFLDAPRAHPGSGELARKCASCRDWYPVVSAEDSSE